MKVFEKKSRASKVTAVFVSMMLVIMMFTTPAYAAMSGSDQLIAVTGTGLEAQSSTDEVTEMGDFYVTGDTGNCMLEGDALIINGSADEPSNVTVSTDGNTSQRIVIAGNATLTLNGVNITPSANAPGIKVNPDVTATITLAEGSENIVNGTGGYAGVEVSWASGAQFADLTIDGTGSLVARGGATDGGGAGIGGSKSANGVYGNITINGGAIDAMGTGRGAGIGSSDNPADGTSHGSFKYIEEQWGAITINGGDIKATGCGNGAGIGGGNHTSSGKIVINGGTVDAQGDTGIGAGLGSGSGATKGPGYYFADVTINGGDITSYATNSMGAGIGGGMYSDACVTINGGVVRASVNPSGNLYQGGAGIGGGYQGCAIVTITGGEVYATGGNGSPGIGNGALAASTTTKSGSKESGWSGVKNVHNGNPTIMGADSKVEISGGTVFAQGGYAGAGLGSGNCSEWSNVIVTGGTVEARGYASTKEDMLGAAGIGSGDSFVPSKTGYMKDTETNVTITGGTVLAVGGWGAAGIGSGANNKTAATITLDGKNANIEAYADGTKFAIDTRLLADDGSTSSITEGREVVNGYILQGTYIHKYTDEDGNDQGTEGLATFRIVNSRTGDYVTFERMPEGYRSFASDVAEEGTYYVFTDAEAIGNGEGRFFSFSSFDNDGAGARSLYGDREGSYTVKPGMISDNCYLFPVKTVAVEKEILVDESVPAEMADEVKSQVNATFHFAIQVKNADGSKGDWVTDKNGNPWIESIDVVNGVPQTKAYFINVSDAAFDVWEVDESGETLNKGVEYGPLVLTKIRTAHNGTDKNNADLSDKDTWVDMVTVKNTFKPTQSIVPETPGTETPEVETPDADPTGETPGETPGADPTGETPGETPGADPTGETPGADPTGEKGPGDEPSTKPATPASTNPEPKTTDTESPEQPATTPEAPETPATSDEPSSQVAAQNETPEQVTPIQEEAAPTASKKTKAQKSTSDARTASTAASATAPAAAPTAAPAAAPAAVAPIVAALAGPAEAIESIVDAINPLAAAPEEEAIDDEGNPLAGHGHTGCWVHWYIFLGLLVTAVYSVVVLIRRGNNSHSMKKLDDDTMSGENRRVEQPDQPATLSPQPSLG